jgi:hypothetical protein
MDEHHPSPKNPAEKDSTTLSISHTSTATATATATVLTSGNKYKAVGDHHRGQTASSELLPAP